MRPLGNGLLCFDQLFCRFGVLQESDFGHVYRPIDFNTVPFANRALGVTAGSTRNFQVGFRVVMAAERTTNCRTTCG